MDVRFRGALCYIDAYIEPSVGTHLCRIRYFGNEERWSFAWYNYNREKYEPGPMFIGGDHCTPEEALDACVQLL
jgi:hypothetical protein